MQHNLFISFISFAASYIISLTLYFPFRRLADQSGFNAIPNARSSHRKHIPNIGGLMFYLSILVTISLLWKAFNIRHVALLSVLAVLSFLIIGLVDDKGSKSARQKFIFQVTGTGLFIAGEQILMNDLFGMTPLIFPINFIITFLFILAIINAMNLIDGIDGLAGSISLFIFFCIGILFFQHDQTIFSVFSFSMSGILLAFLFFNFSRKYKMIMGDTGSLWLGFSLSILLIKASQIPGITGFAPDLQTGLHMSQEAVFGLIIIPVFDLVRVFFVRLLYRRSPFRADRNHIHHLMIDKIGMSHWQATLSIVSLNFILFLIIYIAGSYLSGIMMLGLYVLLFIGYNIILYSIADERILFAKRKAVSSKP